MAFLRAWACHMAKTWEALHAQTEATARFQARITLISRHEHNKRKLATANSRRRRACAKSRQTRCAQSRNQAHAMWRVSTCRGDNVRCATSAHARRTRYIEPRAGGSLSPLSFCSLLPSRFITRLQQTSHRVLRTVLYHITDSRGDKLSGTAA